MGDRGDRVRGKMQKVAALRGGFDPVLVCDEPAEGSEVSLGTVVNGWAFSPAGIKEVSVWLEGQQVGKAELGLERPDVVRDHPNWSDALHSGFRYYFEDIPETAVEAESAELAVVAEDGEGRRVEVRRVVQPVESSPLPMADPLYTSNGRDLEDPLVEISTVLLAAVDSERLRGF